MYPRKYVDVGHMEIVPSTNMIDMEVSGMPRDTEVPANFQS